jgi:hypothetical protein
VVGGLRVKAHRVEPLPRQVQQKPTGGKFDDMPDDIPFASCGLGDDVIYRKLRWGYE